MSAPSLIMISHVFPPDNAIGAVRVGKFAEGLARDYGWSVHAVVPRSSSAVDRKSANGDENAINVHPSHEIDMLRQMTALRSIVRREKENAATGTSGETDIRLAKTAPTGRGALARFSDLIAVPDTHSGWIYFAFREAVRCLKRASGATVIYSSGPPHSAHVAAAMAKRRTDRPWIADLRDPWTDNPYNAPLAPLAQRWNQRLERRTLEAADVILCTTEPARERLLALLPNFSGDRIVTLPNGYDPEDFTDIRPQRRWPESSLPVLLHAGSVYGKRDPTAFLQALRKFRAEAPEFCPRAVFVGPWEEEVLARANSIIAATNDPHLVTMLPVVSRREALAMQAAADWLILLGDSTPEMLQIPGKLFEYLAMRKPVLSLFPNGSPVEPYLESYAARFASAAPNDVDSILAALRIIADATRSLRHARRPVEELERSSQIARLSTLLKTTLAGENPGRAASRESEAASAVG